MNKDNADRYANGDGESLEDFISTQNYRQLKNVNSWINSNPGEESNNYVMSNGQPKNVYTLNFAETVQAVFFSFILHPMPCVFCRNIKFSFKQNLGTASKLP